MLITRKIVVAAISATVLVGVTPLLTACNPQALVQNAVENAVKDATGVDVNVNGDGTASQSLPDGWPSSIPVVSGTIEYSGSLGSGGDTTWTVSIKIDDAKTAYEQAKSQLTGAGFENTLDSSANGTYGGMFSSPEYSIVVTADDSVDPKTINYVVSTAAAITG